MEIGLVAVPPGKELIGFAWMWTGGGKRFFDLMALLK